MSVEDVTPNERAALLAVCQPFANEAIAAHQLGISEAALRSRLRRLYEKLDVGSAAQARHILDSVTPIPKRRRKVSSRVTP